MTEIFAQKPLGVDVSHYNGTINWVSVKNSGITFAWAKASEGMNTGDAYFAGNISNAKAAGVYIGAYHFAHPELNTPADEANHFWNVAGATIKNDGLTLQPTLDYETFSAPNNVPVGATSYSDWANQWCNAIVAKAAAAGITVKPVIYTSTCGASYLDGSVSQWIPWIANPNGLSPQTGSPWSSTPCSSSGSGIWGSGVWSVWQYSWTTTVPGITSNGGSDADVFNGTEAALVSTLIVTATGAPAVSLSPQLLRAVDTGGSLIVTGVVSGTLPLTYQWLFNGTPIPGANTNIFHITDAQTNDSGLYALAITNSFGSVTSSPVSLFVYPPQATVFSDNFDINSATNWIINESSADNSVNFNFDYSTLGIPSAPHSTGNTTRGVQMKANLSLGAIAALSISPTNQSFTGDYRLHFDAWINVNGPFPDGGQGSTEFLVAGLGTTGKHTEWTGSGSSADGYYFSADGDGGVSASSTTSGDYCAYAGTTLQPTSSGIYLAGTDNSARDNANTYYTNTFPIGHSAPALQQANYAQQTGALSSGTLGFAWHDVVVSKRANTVNWEIDGVRLATISNVTMTASNVFVGFWDPFSSLSSNNDLNFGLVDNVRVEVPAAAPVITLNPQSQLVKLGTHVDFVTEASGLPAPNFQWLFNGTNISGATNASYVIANVNFTNVGNYSVIATNIAGGSVSSSASLALLPPAAAQFSAVTLESDAVVQLAFHADPYWTYTIETSTNLKDWSVLTNLSSTNGSFNFMTMAITNAPQQFYRARVGP